jgi:hypothetical protein
MAWTLDQLRTKIQNDNELHAENFVTPSEIKAFLNDAIEDAEQLIIDSFSDFFLTFVDYNIVEGVGEILVPADMFDLRIRGMYFDLRGFDPNSSGTSQWYKIKKLPLERFSSIYQADVYHYRLTNPAVGGPKIGIYPDFREDLQAKVRLWYIREAVRLDADTDILEAGIRPQYVLAHAKVAIMEKEGDPMLDTMQARLEKQTEKLISSISRVVDDDEDSFLEMDFEALDEAYGSQESGPWS